MADDAPSLGHIGRYELLTRLGVGGMGEVFHARATGAAGFEKYVVIKRILPHLAQDPIFVERFVAEGKLVVQLDHASIAQVYDLGEENGVPYLAMEYVDGRDLRELMVLARDPGLRPSVEIRAHLLVGILEALDYAHRVTDARGEPLGIIHRDVSPANVMVSRNGEVKLVDFGIARAATRTDLSLPGALQGKYAYMSPEQAEGNALDGRSDLFSVGVLAWELFVGARPFDGETDLATLDRIRSHDPGSLAEASPDAPPEVVDVVDRLLSKDPHGRPATAADAVKTLKGLFLRRGVLVSARDVAEWLQTTLQSLPPAQRQQPGGSMSLDDALGLPMGGGSSPSGAEKTATVSVIPGTAPPLFVPDLSTVAPTKRGRAPTAQELSAYPQTIGPVRRRGRLLSLLVSLNLLLLGSVAFLVWQQSAASDRDAKERPREPGAPASAPARSGEAPSETETPPAAAAQESAPVPVAPADGPPPGQRSPGIQATPADAAAPRARPIPGLRPPLVTTSSKGKVVFRFYPASSKVVLDGRTLNTSASNLVQRDLEAGKHRLLLIGPDGVQRSESFEVKAGKTTNLTTLHVTARSP
jgi:serine/threonine protein kinase